ADQPRPVDQTRIVRAGKAAHDVSSAQEIEHDPGPRRAAVRPVAVVREAPECGRNQGSIYGEHAVQVPRVAIAVGPPGADDLAGRRKPEDAVREGRDGNEPL